MLINGEIRVFSGTANPKLATHVCEYMEIPVGSSKIEPFPDGEVSIKLEDDVRGRDCFIIQSTCPPVNETLMELLIFIDCLRRASAERITAVLPYFGYARQDRKSEGRTPITAKLVANLICTAGVDRVLAMDLHAEQVQGFFDIPVDHLQAAPVLVDYYMGLDLPDPVLVSPDLGNVKTANRYAEFLGGQMAVIDKRRESGRDAVATRVIGDVDGKDVLMIDDMITTAGTMCSAASYLRDHGARSIRVGATHGVFAHPAAERFADSPIDEVVVTDTVPISDEVRKKINPKILSVAQLLGEAIVRIHQHESVSAIFRRENIVTSR